MTWSTPTGCCARRPRWVRREEGEHPDHIVVIQYVPAVGDSKRAIDEYYSEIFWEASRRSTSSINARFVVFFLLHPAKDEDRIARGRSSV
jgi:hypothetical protein